jgi:hypothetical protein
MQDIVDQKKLHALTVAEYMTLEIATRTELLGGAIFDVSPKNEPHSLAVSELATALCRGLPNTYRVRVQDPLAVSGWHGIDAPEVDVAVVAARHYAKTPTAKDAFALIEISDTTYGERRGDRRYKIPLYVRAGVPAWIVNIPARRVEQYGCVADLERDAGHVFDESATLDILGVAIPVGSLFA